MQTRRLVAVTTLAALLACSSAAPPEPGTTEEVLDTNALQLQFQLPALATVMTRNVYLGADIFRVLGAPTPQDIPAAVGTTFAMVKATDFPARARNLAWEVALARPDLLSLQEVGLWRTGPGDSCVGGALPATDVAFDFLAILEAELARLGARYQVAAQVQNFDGELCGLVDGAFADVRYTDRDVLLVRADRAFANPASGNFQARLSFPVAGVKTVDILRGWVAADVRIGGRWVRAVGAHLEVETGPFGLVQRLQGQELVAMLAGETRPLFLAGDFNSAADGSTTPTLADIVAAGYVDPWAKLRPNTPGPTCCFDEALRSGTLQTRIDVTLARNGPRPLLTFRLGSLPWERTRSGLWPSDHAGVVTLFALP
jgi:hypothetical protein